MAGKIKNFSLGVSLFLTILILWQLLHFFRVIPLWLLPGPKETFSVFWNLVFNGTLPKLLLVSFANIFPAFAAATVASLFLGVLVGVNAALRKIFTPFLSAVYLVPSLAWLPLIILFFGFTRQTIWAVIFISSFVRIIYNVIAGVMGVNLNWLLVAQNLNIGKVKTVIKVVFPGALPQILSGVRVGFGSAWRSLVGAEMLVVTAGGLGKYIWMSQWSFNFEQVLSGIITIALVGVIAEEFIFKKVEQATLTKWGLVQS